MADFKLAFTGSEVDEAVRIAQSIVPPIPPVPPSPPWTRPADRPIKPEMVDNTVLMLFGVGEKSPNDMAFLFTTSAGQYSVDWGDGEVTLHNSNVKAEHLYDFDTLALPVDSVGYKMAWITVRPVNVDANILTFNTQQRHSLRSTSTTARLIPQVFEVYIQCPALTGITWTPSSNTVAVYRLLEIFSLDINNATSLDRLLADCNNLQQIEKLYIEKATAITNFMTYCNSYNQPFPAGVTFENVTTHFMTYCSSYNQPFPDSVTFANVTTNFMDSCSSYNQPFPDSVTFANVTTNFMFSCKSYNQPFPAGVTFENVTTNFMASCNSYNQPFPAGVTFANVTTNFMANCNSYNQPFPDSVTFANVTTYFMASCNSYNQPFPDSVTFANVTTNFMASCNSYNQPFPDSVTFANVTTNFMQYCSSYNQPFPDSVTFANVTTNFMDGCKSYNQPFPAGVTFANVTTNFMASCNSYNHSVTVNLATQTTAMGTSSFGSCYALKAIRLLDMTTVQSAFNISNSSLDVPALVDLFSDLFNRTATTAGTITITGVFGAARLTPEQRAIATAKSWTIIG